MVLDTPHVSAAEYRILGQVMFEYLGCVRDIVL